MVRSLHSSRRLFDEAAPAPAAEEKKQVELTPKVQAIVDELLTLNIMETVQLVDVLKEKFGYVEATVMAGPAAGAAPAAAAEEEIKAPEQTEFTVRLEKFDASSKIKVIKEVRSITGLGLKQAKELVEAAPKSIIKEGLMKEDATVIVNKLKEVGGEAVVE